MTTKTLPWCPECCTQHDGDWDCPGDLLATGPERHGWRVLVERPEGPEVYGTLIAQAGDRWRARILTYPNILWVLPSGGTMKFVASSPGDVQKVAADYIRQHCQRCGLTARTEVAAPVEGGDVPLEQNPKAARSKVVQASQRRLRAMYIQYGIGRPKEEAETEDLSEGGLFIKTDSPMPIGTDVAMRLELEGFSLPLAGIVCWVKERDEDGKPAGMGVKLDNPHPRYVHYVRQQRKTSEVTEHALEELKKDAAGG